MQTVALVALALAAALGPALRTTGWGPLLGVAVLLVGAAVWIRHVGTDDRLLYTILAVTLAARVLLVVVDTSFGLFPKLDAVGYHQRAATLAEAWWHGTVWEQFNSFNTYAYEAVVAIPYFWFGAAPLLARVLNAVMGTLAVFNVYRIGEITWDRRPAVAGAAAFALLPSIVRVHGEHLREALMILVITEVVYLVLSERFREPVGAAALVLSLMFVFFVRQPTFVVLVPALAVWAALRLRSWLHDRTASAATSSIRSRHVATVVGVLVAIGAAWMFLGEEMTAGPRSITETRDAWTAGGSSYLGGVVFETWLDVVAFLPIGAIYFLFTPFPWQVHNVLALAGAAENLLLFYPLTLAALPGLVRSRDIDRVALALFLVVAALAYGLIEGNVGTALRHRAQFTWVIFLFAGPVLVEWWDRSRSDPGSLNPDGGDVPEDPEGGREPTVSPGRGGG